MKDWMSCEKSLPDRGVVVETAIIDSWGARNEQPLKRGDSGKLWFVPDGSMYVYYSPTHWRPVDVTDARELIWRLRDDLDARFETGEIAALVRKLRFFAESECHAADEMREETIPHLTKDLTAMTAARDAWREYAEALAQIPDASNAFGTMQRSIKALAALVALGELEEK